ncbi:hypothetical protein KBB08_00250 [Candidatus Gracilibacteria bacterium]|nr:hypothetical protein [Candidatus Gracilibacteria bacterium]
MKKFLVGLTLLCTACGSVPPPAPSPTPTSTSSIDPRCMMSPEARPRPEEGIICPGATTPDSVPTSPSSIPTPTASGDPSSLPTATPSPRAAVTSSDIACLSGRWHQGASELLFQYLQALPTTPILVAPGSSVDYNFTRTGNRGTFTQTFNNVVLQTSKASTMSRNGRDDYEFTFNGSASGSFQKNDDGKIYFFDVRPEGTTLSLKVNGVEILSDPNLSGDMLPVYATEVGVRCGTTLEMTYQIPGRPVTLYLDR